MVKTAVWTRKVMMPKKPTTSKVFVSHLLGLPLRQITAYMYTQVTRCFMSCLHWDRYIAAGCMCYWESWRRLAMEGNYYFSVWLIRLHHYWFCYYPWNLTKTILSRRIGPDCNIAAWAFIFEKPAKKGGWLSMPKTPVPTFFLTDVTDVFEFFFFFGSFICYLLLL